MDASSLASRVRERILSAGFDEMGVAPCALDPTESAHLEDWLDAGYAGSMQWLERHREVRRDLRARFPWARSVVVATRGYRPAGATGGGIAPYVSSYARGADYHDVLEGRLRGAAEELGRELPSLRFHPYVDTGPVMERQLAEAAGLGWRGHHGLLLDATHGSRFFLGVLITDLDLEPTPARTPGCGSCRACQVACPTDAFVEPGVLDARRCISYLTIEHRGPIDRDLRPAMGQWLFGCDLCQTCCPFEHRARATGDAAFEPGEALTGISLATLLGLDETGFRERFHGTPLWRPRREGLLRNALIVAANGEHVDCLQPGLALLEDPSPTLREAASWSVTRLGGDAVAHRLEAAREIEDVDFVRAGLEEDLRWLRDRR